MDRSLTAEDLTDIADGGINDLRSLRVHPLDPALPATFAEFLAVPMSIEKVERVEAAAKDLYRHVLTVGRAAQRDECRAFMRFFHTVGFLFKYKSYGVKIASPFGYSLFQLNDGEGFSFQLHKEPKLEAFHILGVQPDSFVYLSTLPEWKSGGVAASKEWAERGGVLDSPFAVRPSVGDVFRVSSTELVHSVVGCTLEEYASCSVDAVERLLDQNKGRVVVLPDAHADVSVLIDGSYAGSALRFVDRDDGQWHAAPLDGRDAILGVTGQLGARRICVAPGSPADIAVRNGWLAVLVPLSCDVLCMAGETEWPVLNGQLFVSAPGHDVRVVSRQQGMLALHSVSCDLVLREWTR